MKKLLFISLLLLTFIESQAASTIIEITPTGGTSDKRILLSNSNFARTWNTTLGTNWTKLRVALRYTMTNTAANLTGTPRFAIGVCAGTNNIFQDATCSNFVGMVTGAATWSYLGGPPPYYNNQAPVAATKVGATLTLGGAMPASGTFYITGNPGVTNRTIVFLDVTKGVGTNITLRAFFQSGAITRDIDYDQFLLLAEMLTPAATTFTLSAEVSAPPVTESVNGYLNSVNVAWDRTSPAIQICDIAIVKLQ